MNLVEAWKWLRETKPRKMTIWSLESEVPVMPEIPKKLIEALKIQEFENDFQRTS